MKHTRFTQAMNDLDDDLILETYQKMRELDAVASPARASRQRRWMAWELIAASFLLVLTGTLMWLRHVRGAIPEEPTPPPTAPHTVIAIDVNPSMELEIDGNETVIATRALNREAEAVLQSVSLNGTHLTVAMDTLVDALVRGEYLTDEKTTILISVAQEDMTYAELLQTSLSQQVTARLKDKQMEASVMTQIYDKNETASSEDGELSTAKAALVRKIQDAKLPGTETMTYEQLAALSIDELNALVEAHPYLMVDIYSRLKRRFPELTAPRDVLDFVLADAAAAPPDVTDIEIKLSYMWNYLCVYTVVFHCDGEAFRYEVMWKESEPVCSILAKRSLPVAERTEAWGEPPIYLHGDIALELVLRDIGPLPEQDGVNTYSQRIRLTTWNRERAVYEIEVIKNDHSWNYAVDAVSGEFVRKEIRLPS